MAESFFTNPTINKEDIVVNEQILEKDKDKTTTEIITNKLPLPVQEGIELVGDIKEEGFVKTEPDEEVVASEETFFTNPTKEDTTITDWERIKYGFDKQTWLFKNLWRIGKAKISDVLDNNELDDKTFKEHIQVNEAKRQEELKNKHWKFASGKYDDDSLVKIAEFATVIFDPYYLLAYATPWGRAATRSYMKMAAFSGLTVGFDVLIRDLATTGDVNKSDVALATSAGAVLGPVGLKLFKVLGKYFPKSDSKQLAKVSEYVENNTKKKLDNISDTELAAIKKALADEDVIAANKIIESDLNFMKKFKVQTDDFIAAEKSLLSEVKNVFAGKDIAKQIKKLLKQGKTAEAEALQRRTYSKDYSGVQVKAKLSKIRTQLQNKEIKYNETKIAYLKEAEKKFLSISDKIGKRNKLLLENLYKQKGLTEKVMQSILSYGTMPLVGALGGGTFDALFGKEKGVLKGMAWGFAAGATLRQVRASKVLDLATKDKFMGIAWSDNAKLWWQKARELTSGTLATKLESFGGNTRVFGLQLLENIDSPMAGKAVVNRVYILQKEWEAANHALMLGEIRNAEGALIKQVKPFTVAEEAKALSIIRGADDSVLLDDKRAVLLADGIKKQLDKFNKILNNAGIYKELENVKFGKRGIEKIVKGKEKEFKPATLKSRIKKFDVIENYFPRVYNAQKIIQDPKAFFNTIKEIFTKLKASDPDKSARDFLNYGKHNADNGNFSVIEDAIINNFVNNPNKKFVSDRFFVTPLTRHITRERILTGSYKNVERVLEQKGYLINDVEQVLNDLGTKSFKSVAFTERFGPNGEFIKPLIKGIRDKYAAAMEDAGGTMQTKLTKKTQAEVKVLKDTINAYFDRYGNRVNQAWSTGIGILSTGSNLAMLNNVFLASLGDFMQGFANARNMTAWLKGFSRTSFLAKHQKGPARWLNTHFDVEINKALKKSLAVEADASLADVATWMSAQNAGKSLRWANDQGFKVMGMTWLTGTARRFAFNVGVGDGYASSRQLYNVVIKGGNSIKSKKATEILLHLEKLGISAEQALKIGSMKYSSAINNTLGKKVLTKAGLATTNRDAILPQVSNRLLFTQNLDPRYRIFGQFMSWAMAKSSQTSKMLQRVENGDVKTLIKLLMAIPVYSGIQNVRELLKYGEIRTSFDYDKQKWFAEGTRLSGNLGWLSELLVGRWMGYGAKDNPLLFFPAANWIGNVWDTGQAVRKGKFDTAVKKSDKWLPFPIYRRLLKQFWDDKIISKAYDISGSNMDKSTYQKLKSFSKGGRVQLKKGDVVTTAASEDANINQNDLDLDKAVNEGLKEQGDMNIKDLASVAAAATIATTGVDADINKAVENNILPPPIEDKQILPQKKPDQINWKFIGKLEGEGVKTGYVPTKKTGEIIGTSGVTIATGVDLGTKDRKFFEDMDVSEEIILKLEPFFNLKGEEALLNAKKLKLSASEVKELDTAIKKKYSKDIINQYEKDSGKNFEDLTSGQQTVITSVAFQHGLKQTTSYNFWDQVITDDWDGAITNLRDWDGTGEPSQTQTRRDKEADLLEGLFKKRQKFFSGDVVEDLQSKAGVKLIKDFIAEGFSLKEAVHRAGLEIQHGGLPD